MKHIFVLLVCIYLFSGLALASYPVLISTASSPYPWDQVTLWGSTVTEMISGQEPIVKFSLPANDKIRSWFPTDIFMKDGSSSSTADFDFGDYGRLKSNRYFLLGYGDNWENASKVTPVILVHGAGDDMNRAWAHPAEIQTPSLIVNTGLMQLLAARGYAVFAISFPHTQGNNLIQGQLLADAIQVVKNATGASQVDIIAHSKGNIAAISYLSSMNEEYSSMNWMDDYRGDVRRYIAVGAPFKGLDTMFRYYMANINAINDNTNCSLAFYNAYTFYSYRDYHRWDSSSTYGNNYFQGQTQLLHNWVNDTADPIGFTSESWTSGDFNNTMYKLYFGGTSLYVSSEGIDQVIVNSSGNQGTNSFISKMNNRGLDPNIDLYVLYGTKQAISYLYGWYPVGEKAADSDGLLFTASSTYTAGMTCRGADLIKIEGMNYNHLEIASEYNALNWIETQLR